MNASHAPFALLAWLLALLALLAQPVNAADISVEDYGYPLANPFEATIATTPLELRAPVPSDDDIDQADYSVRLRPEREFTLPDNFWAVKRMGYRLARQDGPAPLIFIISGWGKIAGYASYGDWRPFDGFRHSVEHSVYVEKDFYGRGLGKALMTALIERARAGKIHVMIAAIEAGNTGSIALHKSLGFRLVGTHHEVGQKFGRWLDLTMMELKLG